MERGGPLRGRFQREGKGTSSHDKAVYPIHILKKFQPDNKFEGGSALRIRPADGVSTLPTGELSTGPSSQMLPLGDAPLPELVSRHSPQPQKLLARGVGGWGENRGEAPAPHRCGLGVESMGDTAIWGDARRKPPLRDPGGNKDEVGEAMSRDPWQCAVLGVEGTASPSLMGACIASSLVFLRRTSSADDGGFPGLPPDEDWPGPSESRILDIPSMQIDSSREDAFALADLRLNAAESVTTFSPRPVPSTIPCLLPGRFLPFPPSPTPMRPCGFSNKVPPAPSVFAPLPSCPACSCADVSFSLFEPTIFFSRLPPLMEDLASLCLKFGGIRDSWNQFFRAKKRPKPSASSSSSSEVKDGEGRKMEVTVTAKAKFGKSTVIIMPSPNPLPPPVKT